jgi:hypothetical protein
MAVRSGFGLACGREWQILSPGGSFGRSEVMRKGRLAGALGSWWCGHPVAPAGFTLFWGLPTVPPLAPPWATFWPPLRGWGWLASLGCVGLGDFRPTRMSALPDGRPTSPAEV